MAFYPEGIDVSIDSKNIHSVIKFPANISAQNENER